MFSDELRGLLKPISRFRWLFWSGCIVPIAPYFVICYLMSRHGPDIGKDIPDYATVLLGVIGAASVPLGLVMHYVLFSEKRIARCMRSVPEPEELARNVRTRQVDQVKALIISRLSEQERGLYNFARKSVHYAPLLTGVAHTCAVAGFIVALLEGRPMVFLPFAAGTAVAAVFMMPRLEGRLEAFLAHRELHRPPDSREPD